jgi:hypothetical protein
MRGAAATEEGGGGGARESSRCEGPFAGREHRAPSASRLPCSGFGHGNLQPIPGT